MTPQAQAAGAGASQSPRARDACAFGDAAKNTEGCPQSGRTGLQTTSRTRPNIQKVQEGKEQLTAK